MTVEVKVPDIGDFTDVPVVTVLVSVGDRIALEDPIVELESDKATMEVPSSAAGVVKEIKVSEGDKVSEGSLILILEADGAADAPKEAPKEEPKAEAPKAAAPAAAPAPAPAPAPAEVPPSLPPPLPEAAPPPPLLALAMAAPAATRRDAKAAGDMGSLPW